MAPYLGYTLGLGASRSYRGGGSSVDERFIIKVDTTKDGSANDTMIIPTTGSGFDCTVDWGDGNTDSYTGEPGLTTIQHTYASGGEKTIYISGTFPRIYFNNTGERYKLLEVVNWGNYGLSENSQERAFYGCGNLTAIAEDWKLNNTLIYGFAMFTGSILELLPDNMTLNALQEAKSMFFNSNLNSLPSEMVLENLTDGRNMFMGSRLNSLPNEMTLESLTQGDNIFTGNTINTTDYSNLLIRMEANNTNTGVDFHGGNSKYNTDGETARNALTSRDPAWTITDSGLDV